MPPHRDWTRRGAGRALLYWPLTSFLLAAAFPALAVQLVLGSGLALLVLGTVAGMIGKRWRAFKLARHRAVAPTAAAAPRPAQAAWPTGRHARRPRTVPDADQEPAHPGRPQPHAA